MRPAPKRVLSAAGAAALLGATLLAGPPASAQTTLTLGGDSGSALLTESIASSFDAKFHGSLTTGDYAAVGSTAGIAGVAGGSLDLAVSARDPVTSDPHGLVFTPFARSSLVVIVNPKNPICHSGLTKQQVASIFTGQATTWGAVGGTTSLGALAPYMRAGSSGTQVAFARLFLSGAAPKGHPLYSDGAIRAQVARQTGAIGFVLGAYAATSKAVCGVPIAGVAPTTANTASGRYRFWTYEYLVTKGAPAGDTASFVTFARSAAVQQAIVPRYAVPVPASVSSVTT
jgi:phosphate transport system substrate-binding protein